MYMPGRLRTASSPLRTVMLFAPYPFSGCSLLFAMRWGYPEEMNCGGHSTGLQTQPLNIVAPSSARNSTVVL